MGRVKLKIKRLENTNSRQATYAKRRNGIIKKALELSILCDIDIILLMFSPTGKPALCRGRRSNIEEVITKFAQLTQQERAKRKLEGLEALKKTFKKLDHDVNVQEFLGTSTQTVEVLKSNNLNYFFPFPFPFMLDLSLQCIVQDLKNNATFLRTCKSEILTRLSHWTELDKINNAEQLEQMEKSLGESINQLRLHKENIQKQQLESLQCRNQFNETADQHLKNISWIANSDSQHMVLIDDSNLLLPRDTECSASSSSFGSFASYLGSCQKPDLSNPGQENGVLSDMNGAAYLRLQLCRQFPYLPYNFNLQNDTRFQPSPAINPHENPIDYHPNQSFEAPRLAFDSNNHGWAFTSEPCAVTTMFDEYLYPQGPQ